MVPTFAGMVVLLILSVGCDSTAARVGGPPAKRVPDVVGRDLIVVSPGLAAAGTAVSVVKRVSHRPSGIIIGQTPPAGATMEPGTRLVLTVSAGLPEVPDISFLRLKRAAYKIRRAGFRVNIVERTDRFGLYESGDVVDQRPGAYSARMPGSIVTLVVAKAPQCTPGYSPCLPPAPDYDCAGGTGNGPFTGFHIVTGFDPYDLDHDNDGRGCE